MYTAVRKCGAWRGVVGGALPPWSDQNPLRRHSVTITGIFGYTLSPNVGKTARIAAGAPWCGQRRRHVWMTTEVITMISMSEFGYCNSLQHFIPSVKGLRQTQTPFLRSTMGLWPERPPFIRSAPHPRHNTWVLTRSGPLHREHSGTLEAAVRMCGAEQRVAARDVYAARAGGQDMRRKV